MELKLTEDIAQAVQQQGVPLRLMDAAGQVYYVLTSQQFQHYVYDDSELTDEEMQAAAASQIDDPAAWGTAGLDAYDQEDPRSKP